MRSIVSLILIALVVLGLYLLLTPDEEKNSITRPVSSTTMEIRSPAFSDGGIIPTLYTCDGDNINPPLTISDVPEDAQSLVLIMEDPDVPAEIRDDQMFDHWVLYNIPANTQEIPENTTGISEVGKNTSGKDAYTGPCPPSQYEPTEHRYFFKIYALDTTLTFAETPSKQDVLSAIEGHVLEEAELMGRYDRSER